jgi:hypothetical protein
MTGRRIRNLLLLAAAVGIGFWIYRDRPTLQGLIDGITGPLFGSRAAVKSSERNRVVGDATVAISEQVELPVESLREGMSGDQVRDLLGNPDKREKEVVDGVEEFRWTYTSAARVLVMRNNRVVKITVVVR